MSDLRASGGWAKGPINIRKKGMNKCTGGTMGGKTDERFDE